MLLIADDFDRTCAFYRDVLGLLVDESWDNAEPDGRGVVFRCGGARIEVLYQRAAGYVVEITEGRTLPLTGRPAGLVVELPDVDALHERLSSQGVGPIGRLWDTPWGHRGFRVADPDGFVLTLVSSADA